MHVCALGMYMFSFSFYDIPIEIGRRYLNSILVNSRNGSLSFLANVVESIASWSIS